MIIFTPSFLMNIITAIIFYFYWLKNYKAVIYISLLSFIFIDINLPIFFILAKDDDFLLSILKLNYGIFSVIFAITAILIFFGIFLLLCICSCMLNKN